MRSLVKTALLKQSALAVTNLVNLLNFIKDNAWMNVLKKHGMILMFAVLVTRIVARVKEVPLIVWNVLNLILFSILPLISASQSVSLVNFRVLVNAIHVVNHAMSALFLPIALLVNQTLTSLSCSLLKQPVLTNVLLQPGRMLKLVQLVLHNAPFVNHQLLTVQPAKQVITSLDLLVFLVVTSALRVLKPLITVCLLVPMVPTSPLQVAVNHASLHVCIVQVKLHAHLALLDTTSKPLLPAPNVMTNPLLLNVRTVRMELTSMDRNVLSVLMNVPLVQVHLPLTVIYVPPTTSSLPLVSVNNVNSPVMNVSTPHQPARLALKASISTTILVHAVTKPALLVKMLQPPLVHLAQMVSINHKLHNNA